ncbi:DUF1559 family PulG-like putative transporter [Singulisphaera acidiphila]|nr:DUF1559 domain-containing protein [Singulisphaera acidiphila]
MARSSNCFVNFSYISVMLFDYHNRYGHFPPAYVADRNGKPMHSWRVLLLEFTDTSLYNAYNFNEPWDGPNNRKLADKMPSFYACPNDHDIRSTPTTSTSYVVVVGPGTAFPDNRPAAMTDVCDPSDQTILIAEMVNSGINWMEPRDLDMNRMSFMLNDTSRPSISSNDPGGPGVVFVDGKKKRLAQDLTRDALRAMITIDGGAIEGPKSFP